MDDAFFVVVYILVARLILSVFPGFLPIILLLTYTAIIALDFHLAVESPLIL
jgi:hypothetical protein